MKITKIRSEEIRIQFETTQPSGRKKTEYIRINFPGKYQDQTFVNIPASGDIQPQDIPNLIKALELSEMIASGELVIS